MYENVVNRCKPSFKTQGFQRLIFFQAKDIISRTIMYLQLPQKKLSSHSQSVTTLDKT